LVFPSESIAIKCVELKILSHKETFVVIQVFLNVAVFASQAQD